MFSSRRERRGRRTPSTRAVARTPFQQVLALAAGRPVFTADYYAVDGVSGKVASFIDWNDPSHTLAQATSANQVALPAAHADFGGKLCATFTGVERYPSVRTAGQFSYISDGTGFESFDVVTFTSFPAQQCTWGAQVFPGCQHAVSAAGGYVAGVYNASAQVVATTSGGTVSAGVPTYLNLSHGTAKSPQWEKRVKGTVGASGAYVNPPSGAPANSLVLGSLLSGGSQPAFMRFRSLMFFPVLSTSQRTQVQQYIQADTGIAP
jgi:hypothetical protein